MAFIIVAIQPIIGYRCFGPFNITDIESSNFKAMPPAIVLIFWPKMLSGAQTVLGKKIAIF